MVMVAVPFHTIFVGVSPGSQSGCLARQSHYLLSFFINPRCPSSVAPGVPATDPGLNIREELSAESLPAAEDGLGTQTDSPARVAGENEEPDASNAN